MDSAMEGIIILQIVNMMVGIVSNIMTTIQIAMCFNLLWLVMGTAQLTLILKSVDMMEEIVLGLIIYIRIVM